VESKYAAPRAEYGHFAFHLQPYEHNSFKYGGPERDADRLRSPSIEVKNTWIYISISQCVFVANCFINKTQVQLCFASSRIFWNAHSR
jgi:hypothetical protein